MTVATCLPDMYDSVGLFIANNTIQQMPNYISSTIGLFNVDCFIIGHHIHVCKMEQKNAVRR
jgi:hypothetical protein